MPKNEKKSLGEPMVDEEDVISFIEAHMCIPRVNLLNYIIDPKVIDLIPESLAREHILTPLFKTSDTLTIAMADPMDIFAIDMDNVPDV